MKRVLAYRIGCFWGIAVLIISSSLAVFYAPKVHAACDVPMADYGSVTTSVDISYAGSYRVWSRLSNPSGTPSAYLLEVDEAICLQIGGQENEADTWTWIDYQDGNIDAKAGVDLSTGQHIIKIIGVSSDVRIDRILFLPEEGCTPDGTGDSCLEVSTPLGGDVNSDNVVNVFDLSALLGNWGKSGVTRSQGDLNGDNIVNVFDLSVVLMNWGKTK